MPKNTKGGTGHKKQKNSSAHPKTRRAVDIAKKSAEFEVYGRVLRPLGNRRMEVYTQIPDSKTEYQTVMCRIRGSLRKRIAQDDYVLVQLFDFDIKHGQIADVYTLDEVEALKKIGMWDMTDFKPDLTGKPKEADDGEEIYSSSSSDEESVKEKEPDNDFI